MVLWVEPAEESVTFHCSIIEQFPYKFSPQTGSTANFEWLDLKPSIISTDTEMAILCIADGYILYTEFQLHLNETCNMLHKYISLTVLCLVSHMEFKVVHMKPALARDSIWLRMCARAPVLSVCVSVYAQVSHVKVIDKGMSVWGLLWSEGHYLRQAHYKGKYTALILGLVLSILQKQTAALFLDFH